MEIVATGAIEQADNFMCKAPTAAEASAKNSKSKESTDHGKWWQWTMQYLSSDSSSNNKQSTAAAPTEEALSATEPKLALVDRGECLFEDKAANAMRAGANAVVIRNHEVRAKA